MALIRDKTVMALIRDKTVMALIRDKTKNGLQSEENVMHAIAPWLSWVKVEVSCITCAGVIFPTRDRGRG